MADYKSDNITSLHLRNYVLILILISPAYRDRYTEAVPSNKYLMDLGFSIGITKVKINRFYFQDTQKEQFMNRTTTILCIIKQIVI